MVSKFGIFPRSLLEPLYKTGDFEEPCNIVHEDSLRKFLVREIVPLCSFRYASFQGAFDRIASQVIGTIEPPGSKQYLRVFQPRLGKRLQLFSIHNSLCKL
jgi:hypothetical protein